MNSLNIETLYTLRSQRTPATAVFTVVGDLVSVTYYPDGLHNSPNQTLGILLEGVPNEVNIRKGEPLTRDYAKKVWNRFVELGFKRF